jgi:hypothetical protein
MKRTQIVRALFVLALGLLLGSSMATAAQSPAPVPAVVSAPQPAAVSAPLPAFLTAPESSDCAAGGDILSGAKAGECDGCSFQPLNFCTQCCGRRAFCTDTMDGGYCTC